MQLLFLSRWFPFPANNGAKIRVFNLLEQLAARHNIALISFADDQTTDDHVTELKRFCSSVDRVALPVFQPHTGSALLGFFDRRPRSIVSTYSREVELLVHRVARAHRTDVVIASTLDMAAYAVAYPGAPRVLEEIEASVFKRQYLEEARPLARLRKQLMWLKWRNYTQNLLQHFQGCTAVSQPEVDLVREISPGYSNAAVIRNGADLRRLSGHFAEPDRNTLVYTGALTYYVNYDAMRYFIQDVMPLIAQARPDVKLLMAGRTDGVDMAGLPTHPNAIHAGHQSDIRPFVQRGWLSIVPENLGGGTRIKVLESMALGTPVVANSNSVKGLEVTHEHDVLIADTPRELADAILRVLGDPELRERLRVNGRATIERRYDWRAIGAEFNEMVERVAHEPPV